MKYTSTLITALLCLLTYVSTAQNVGVGTNSPNQKLDVAGWIELGNQTEGTTGSEGAIRYNSTSKTIQYYDGTQWIDVTSSSNNDDDWTVNGNDMYNANSGNIGIGTPSPAASYKLDMTGDLRVQGGDVYLGTSGERVYASGDDIRVYSNSGYIDLVPADGSHGIIMRDYTGSTSDWAGMRTVNNGSLDRLEFGLNTSADYGLGLVLREDNRVGIGTTGPSTELHVVGGARVTTLGGSGNALVTSDNSGNLSKNAYSGNSNDVLTGDGNWTDAGSLSVTGDNLGNHSATQDLDMNNNDVLDWASAESRTNATLPHLVLESTGSGDNWLSQGAYISIGESGALGSASMHMTYVGNGYGYVGGGTVTNGLPRSHWRFTYNQDEIMTPDNVYIGTSASSGNDLYASDRIIDWDNTGYYLDINGINRMNEIMGDDGSVTDPSFHFAGDANTGFYQPADNQIGVTINGTERFRVDAAGNVGIGDATPSYKLDVNGNVRTTGDFYGDIHVDDTRSTNSPPSAYNNEVAFDFKSRSAISVGGTGTYGGLMTFAPWGDNSGDATHQMHFNEGGLFWRQGQPDGTLWGSWDQLMTASNVNSFVNGDNLGNHSATTTLDMNSNNITEVNQLTTLGTSNYDKLRVYSSSSYTIGMVSGITPGYLNDWAMTFTMNQDNDRGFIWRDVNDGTADGAMSLTTDGRLWLKSTAHFNGNVGIGTSAPGAALHVDKGTNTNVLIESDDAGASTLELRGTSQGTGRLYVGQSSTYGGGIEYNGDNNPVTTNAGADYITLYRRSAGVDEWTARNRYLNNDWEFREDVDVNGYLTVGNPSTPSSVSSGATFSKLYEAVFDVGANSWSQDTRCGFTTWFIESSTSFFGASRNFIYHNNDVNGDNWGHVYSEWIWIPTGAGTLTVDAIIDRSQDDDDPVWIEYSTNGTSWTKQTSFSNGGYCRSDAKGTNTSCSGGSNYTAWADCGGIGLMRFSLSGQSGKWLRFRFVGLTDDGCDGFLCGGEGGEFRIYGMSVYAAVSGIGGSFAAGNIYAEKNIYAGSNVMLGDVAEYFNVKGEAEAGDLLAFHPDQPETLIKATGAYNTNLMGVYSTAPTVTLNSSSAGSPVALTGRVPVKISDENGKVQIGDYLTAASKAGYAMKATESGFTIGRAMQASVEAKDNKVIALIQPGWYNPYSGFASAQSGGSFAFTEGRETVKVIDAGVKEDSRVFVTFREQSGTDHWVSEVGNGYFEISLGKAAASELPFDYLVDNATTISKPNVAVVDDVIIDISDEEFVNEGMETLLQNLQNTEQPTEGDAKVERKEITLPEADLTSTPPNPPTENESWSWSTRNGFKKVNAEAIDTEKLGK